MCTKDVRPRADTADRLSYFLGRKQALFLLLVTPARTCLSEVSGFSVWEAADSRRLGRRSFGELFFHTWAQLLMTHLSGN